MTSVAEVARALSSDVSEDDLNRIGLAFTPDEAREVLADFLKLPPRQGMAVLYFLANLYKQMALSLLEEKRQWKTREGA